MKEVPSLSATPFEMIIQSLKVELIPYEPWIIGPGYYQPKLKTLEEDICYAQKNRRFDLYTLFTDKREDVLQEQGRLLETMLCTWLPRNQKKAFRKVGGIIQANLTVSDVLHRFKVKPTGHDILIDLAQRKMQNDEAALGLAQSIRSEMISHYDTMYPCKGKSIRSEAEKVLHNMKKLLTTKN
jgi:hypothetical protein